MRRTIAFAVALMFAFLMPVAAAAGEPLAGEPAPRALRSLDIAAAVEMEEPSSPVLTLGSVGGLGYTQWWVPQQEAQEVARVAYDRCVDEVKAYEGTASYTDRLNQCADLYAAS